MLAMTRAMSAFIVAGALGWTLHAQSPVDSSGPRTPVVTTPRFAFYSDFETNLNDALIAAGVARSARRPELFKSGNESRCFQSLSPTARAQWDAAVDYYAKTVSSGDWTGREQVSLRLALAGLRRSADTTALSFLDSASAVRAGAGPVYRQCRWTAQDARNRAWIDSVRKLSGTHEEVIAGRLERLYEQKWRGLPILIDVVETVGWSGANSFILADGGGHLLISPAFVGAASLEIVFHESSHLLMGRNSPVRRALEAAASSANYRLPPDLWHVVLFYQTGEVVKQVVAESGVPDYRPLVYGIFDRGTWTAFRAALEAEWRPYVGGTRTLAEATTALIRALSAR